MKQVFRDKLPKDHAKLLANSKFALVKNDGWGMEIVAHGNDPIAVSCANKPFTRKTVQAESGASELVNVVQDGDKTVEILERDVWPGHELYRIDEHE